MNVDQLWDFIKTTLATDASVESNIYNSYIAPAKLIQSEEENEYLIVVTSLVAKNFLVDFLPLINDLIKRKLHHNVGLKILTTKEYNVQKKTQPEQPSLVSVVKSKYNFANFVVGESNQQAYKAAKKVGEKLGTLWNPLFIYGDSGLGKTHLLKAIEGEINTNPLRLKTHYLTSERFGSVVVDLISKGHQVIEEYKKKLNDYDVLLIDDIQFLAKREKTNEVLFSIFNNFIEEDKQLVITSDKGPDELNGFDQRMITRFNLGLSVKVQAPDTRTATLIIEEIIRDNYPEMSLTEEAIKYLAAYYSSDIRKIYGTINRIAFWKESEHSTMTAPINLGDVQYVLRDVPIANIGKLSTTKIKDIVAQRYGVTVKQIDGKTRTAPVTNARHVAMFLTKDILGLSYVKIGISFGNKDHTTVLNAVDKIQKRSEADKDFKKVLATIKNDITTAR